MKALDIKVGQHWQRGNSVYRITSIDLNHDRIEFAGVNVGSAGNVSAVWLLAQARLLQDVTETEMETWSASLDILLPTEPKCDCGGEKAKTSHSGWCSTQAKP